MSAPNHDWGGQWKSVRETQLLKSLTACITFRRIVHAGGEKMYTCFQRIQSSMNASGPPVRVL